MLKTTPGKDLNPWPNFQRGFYLDNVTEINSQSIFKVQMIRKFHTNSKPLLPESSSKPVSTQQVQKISFHSILKGEFIHVCVNTISCKNTIVSHANISLRPVRLRLAYEVH